MTPKYTEEEFKKAKSKELLPLQCECCGKEFKKEKHYIKSENKRSNGPKYCSRECVYKGMKTIRRVECKQCGKSFLKFLNEIKKYPNHFCGLSCSATYRNTHKTWGVRRSKLEAWLEEQLGDLYVDLEIHYNRNDAISSELDIYIPSLKLAFEISGIWHYEPIYGEEKLANIQKNDARKLRACIDNGIQLCVINTMALKYFKEDRAQKYLDRLIDLIEKENPELLHSGLE